MTSLDVSRANVVDFPLPGEELLTLDELAQAAGRLDPEHVEHHLANLPIVSPEGHAEALPLEPANVVRGLQTNGCWVMLRSLATLPEYEALLRRTAGPFELALRAAGDRPVAHDLVAFLGAPGAVVPVHYDLSHHFLVQVQGSKTVGTGTFSDPQTQQEQLERGMLAHRLNTGLVPDQREEHVLHPGQALIIPASTFHWVEGGDDVSIAITVAVTTDATARASAVHRFNVRARRFGLRPASPGQPRADRWKEQAVTQSKRMRTLARRG